MSSISEIIGRRAVMMVAACGLAVGVGVTGASGQQLGSHRDEPGRDRVSDQPAEVEDEERWYDPRDWFDDERWYRDLFGPKGVDDSEEAGDEWEERTEDERGWWSDTARELYTDAYYDGYFDGYEDDEFGYDDYTIGRNTATEDNGYAAGYYDGFYDAHRGYESDWTYYIVAVPPTEEARASDRERLADRDRRRGDRAKLAGTDDMSEGERMKMASPEDALRIRGRIERTVRVVESDLPETREEHVVQRITFLNGQTVLADLGRRADRVILERGDKVTLYGKQIMLAGEMEVLDVSRVSVNGERMWNAERNSRPVKRKLK